MCRGTCKLRSTKDKRKHSLFDVNAVLPFMPGIPGCPGTPLCPCNPCDPGDPGNPLEPLGPIGPAGPGGPSLVWQCSHLLCWLCWVLRRSEEISAANQRIISAIRQGK